jgi:hypothetical protein
VRDITAGVGPAALQARLTSNGDDPVLARLADRGLPLFVGVLGLAALLALTVARRAAARLDRGCWQLIGRSVASSRAPPALRRALS